VVGGVELVEFLKENLVVLVCELLAISEDALTDHDAGDDGHVLQSLQ
jgi:hypothetical protein